MSIMDELNQLRSKAPEKKKAPKPRVTVKRIIVKSKKGPAEPKSVADPETNTPKQTNAAPVAVKNKKPAKTLQPVKEEEPNVGFRFPKGNKYWLSRSKHGVDGKWTDPNKFLTDCVSYFEWLEDNPLQEAKAFAYQGIVTQADLPKLQAPTIENLCTHLGITYQTWLNYKVRGPDFLEVITYVEQVIRGRKFVGAAADLFNATIISRDLGLADKTEHTGAEGGPIQTITRTIVRPGDEVS